MKLTLQTRAWRRSIPRYRAALNRKLVKILLEEGKTLVKHLIKLTPPHGEHPLQSESFNTQRKIGYGAVERDIKRVLRPLDELDMVTNAKARIRDPILAAAGIRATVSKGGKARKRLNFEETKTLLMRLGIHGSRIILKADPAIHRKARGARGRTPKKSAMTVVVQPRTVKSYVKEARKAVGRAKKGWMPAARFLRVRGISNWIPGARGSAPGSVKLDRGNASHKPSLTVKNQVPYAGDLRAHAIVDVAAKLRGPSMKRKAAKALREVNRMKL